MKRCHWNMCDRERNKTIPEGKTTPRFWWISNTKREEKRDTTMNKWTMSHSFSGKKESILSLVLCVSCAVTSFYPTDPSGLDSLIFYLPLMFCASLFVCSPSNSSSVFIHRQFFLTVILPLPFSLSRCFFSLFKIIKIISYGPSFGTIIQKESIGRDSKRCIYSIFASFSPRGKKKRESKLHKKRKRIKNQSCIWSQPSIWLLKYQSSNFLSWYLCDINFHFCLSVKSLFCSFPLED